MFVRQKHFLSLLAANPPSSVSCEFTGARVLLILLLTFLATPSSGVSGPGGFERLKSLSGDWVGTEANGTLVRASYRLVSGGSVLMETLHVGDMPEMFTMYYLDEGNLMLTHYCSVGNQPRMRAEPITGEIKEITFTFLDATNLSSPSAAHNHGLVVSFDGSNAFTQKWTWRANGRDRFWVFHFRRSKWFDVFKLEFEAFLKPLHNFFPAVAPILFQPATMILVGVGLLVSVVAVLHRCF